jgi:hypothetical protein
MIQSRDGAEARATRASAQCQEIICFAGEAEGSATSVWPRSNEGSDKAIARFECETTRYPRGPFGVGEIALAWRGAWMVEMVPAFNCTELSTPTEIAEALELVAPFPPPWFRSKEGLDVTTPAFAVGPAPTRGLDVLIDEGTARATEAAVTVSVAVLLQALPPTLDTRHRKTALLSVEDT